MADPITLILLVAAGESADPVTRGIAAATVGALGADGRVVVRGSAGPPNDQQALDLEASEHADAVVELRWPSARHREAALRAHVARTNAWVERRIDFRRADADAERERTLAFAMVSLLPEPAAGGAAARSDADAGTANDAAPNGTNASNGTNEVDASNGDGASRETSAPEPANEANEGNHGARPIPRTAFDGATRGTAPLPTDAAPATPPAASNMALEVLVVDAAGDNEGAQEIGGAAAFDWFFWRNVSVRVGGSVRDTSIDEASGDLLKVSASAGLALHPWRAMPSHPFGASLRVDYLVLYERLSRVVPPGQNGPTHDDALSGCDAMVDGSWLFAPSVEVVAGAGVEAFPPTTINQGTATIALPIARAVFEGGLRLRF